MIKENEIEIFYQLNETQFSDFNLNNFDFCLIDIKKYNEFPITLETIKSKFFIFKFKVYSFIISNQIFNEINLYRKINFPSLLPLVNIIKNDSKYLIKKSICQDNPEVMKNQEYLISLDLNLEIENILIKDTFQYDLLNENTR